MRKKDILNYHCYTAAALHHAKRRSFDFLLQSVKLGRRIKLAQCDTKPIAQLFDGYRAGIPAFTVEDAFDRRLWNGGNMAEGVGRYAALFA